MNRARLPLILLIALALTACADPTPSADQPAAAPVVHTLAEGDARATLRVSAAEITTAQRISIDLDVRTDEPSVRLDPDPVFEGWTIADAEHDPVAHTYSWTLEPFLDGQYAIEPITIALGDATTLTTPEVEVLVRSVLAEGDESLAGVKGVVDAPEPDRLWLIALIAGVVAAFVGGCAGLAMLLIARARQMYELRVPAHDLALARLDAALAVESDSLEGAVVRMSDVVRAYIEDRYDMHAPEQTTEEFLAESRASMRFNEEDVALLGRFLTSVDLIKFAGASATPNQAEDAAETLRRFIRSTASPDHTVVISETEAKALPALQTQRVRAGYEFEPNGGAS